MAQVAVLEKGNRQADRNADQDPRIGIVYHARWRRVTGPAVAHQNQPPLNSSMARSFSKCFCTLPEAVRGSLSVMTALLGTLNLASRCVQYASTSSDVVLRPLTGM